MDDKNTCLTTRIRDDLKISQYPVATAIDNNEVHPSMSNTTSASGSSTAIRSIQLKDAFNQMILDHGPYDIFFHTSFRRKTWEDSAKRKFKQFFNRLNTRQFRFYAKYIWVFLTIENNPPGDGVHIHALIQGIPAEYASLLQKKAGAFFGKSKVVPYDPDLPGTHYLSWKYPANDKIADYDLYKINSRLR